MPRLSEVDQSYLDKFVSAAESVDAIPPEVVAALRDGYILPEDIEAVSALRWNAWEIKLEVDERFRLHTCFYETYDQKELVDKQLDALDNLLDVLAILPKAEYFEQVRGKAKAYLKSLVGGTSSR